MKEIAARSGLTAAVKTGTYLGDTAALLRSSFDEVWTVELSPELHARARQRHANTPGINFVLGSSAVILPGLIGEIGRPALFWLDGHWTAGSTVASIAGEEGQCPVMEEIRAIDSYPWSDTACILIDDARLFLGPPQPPYRREDWPTFIEVVDLLRARFERYVTVLDDVIIAGPPEIRSAVEAYWLGVLDRGEDTRARLLAALNPSPSTATRRLVSVAMPESVKSAYRSVRNAAHARQRRG